MRLLSTVALMLLAAGAARADSSVPDEKPRDEATIPGWMEHCAKRLGLATMVATIVDPSFAGATIERSGEKANDYLTWQLQAHPKQDSPRYLIRIGPSLSPFVLRSPAEDEATRTIFDRTFRQAISGCVNDLAAVTIK